MKSFNYTNLFGQNMTFGPIFHRRFLNVSFFMSNISLLNIFVMFRYVTQCLLYTGGCQPYSNGVPPNQYLEQRCPTFLLIGQKFEAKSLGGQVLDLKIKIFVELPPIMT